MKFSSLPKFDDAHELIDVVGGLQKPVKDYIEIDREYVKQMPEFLLVQPLVPKYYIYKGIKIFGSGYWHFTNEERQIQKEAALNEVLDIIDGW